MVVALLNASLSGGFVLSFSILGQVLCNERQNSFVLFWFLKECQFPVFNYFTSEISAVNLIVGWCLFACSMDCIFSSLFKVQRENMSSIHHFQISGFNALWFKISVSTSAMKMLAKATDIFVPMAVPWVCR